MSQPDSLVEYHIAPSEDDKYIHLEVIGDGGRPEMLEITQAAFELGTKLGILCYLCDITQSRNRERVVENVRYTKLDSPTIVPRELENYIAILVDPVDHSHDFIIAFLKSQGVAIDLFWDREEALRHVRAAAKRLHKTDSQEQGDAD